MVEWDTGNCTREWLMNANCLFCGIIAHEQSADIVHEDERTVAFRDIDPKAPTHILVVPREHIPSVNALDEGNVDVVANLLLAAQAIARDEGIADSGYRLVMNTGEEAGQSVDHIHLHVLGGRALTWPPG